MKRTHSLLQSASLGCRKKVQKKFFNRKRAPEKQNKPQLFRTEGSKDPRGGEGIPYGTDGDACQKF